MIWQRMAASYLFNHIAGAVFAMAGYVHSHQGDPWLTSDNHPRKRIGQFYDRPTKRGSKQVIYCDLLTDHHRAQLSTQIN